ncbi:hypothetical protein SLEP1_g39624 [Rubroshorea leprosula]|uniref:B box-type domain-containing protein n=1 Tax=Rubroshorea leprosula TaxID=152421 RepID=A0AAV5L1Y1_9ROSI|nr:hypothetical protein SLEP1_g39624 [Rubroshorea leprosula]
MDRKNFEKKGKMKNCELCNSLAKMFCGSDQAILCWDCDSKVHGANFLVAKHSRTLLCHLCQYPTPWIGSGPKLSPTISVCLICVNNGSGGVEKKNEERNGDLDEEDDVAEGDDSYDDLDEDDDCDIEEDGEENQVVPWSSRPVPLCLSSSTSEESSTRFCRHRANASQYRTAAPASPDREGCCSFPTEQGNVNWSNSSATSSPLRDNKCTK